MSSRLFYLFILFSSKAFCDNPPIHPTVQAGIWADYSQRFEQQYHFPPLSPTLIQQELGSNQASILHFFVDNSAIRLYLLFKEGIYRLTIDTPAQTVQDVHMIVQSIKTWPTAHQSNHLSTYQQKAYQLYHTLLEPVAAMMPLQVRIIPSGVLSELPFEALLHQPIDHSGMPLSGYPYLIKKHQISYMNALQLAASPSETYAPPLKNRVLAYAPIFSADESKAEHSSLSPLYHNQQEVEAISQLFPTDIRSGKSATIDNFLKEAPGYRILHLATHTQWPASGEEHNQLAFTPKFDGSANHLLIDSTLLSQKLHAEMVVLSACESGTAQKNGLTLAAAFTQTGIRSLITTLWQIDDKATAEFMIVFYEYLRQGETKDAALRHAKLYFIQHQAAYYAHPFYWANCVVYGETTPIGSCKKISQPLLYVLIAIFGCGILALFLKKRYRMAT